MSISDIISSKLSDKVKSLTLVGQVGVDICYQFGFDYKSVSLSQNLEKKEE